MFISKVRHPERWPRVWLIALVLAAEITAVVQIPHPWFSIYLYRGVPVFFSLTLLFFGRSQLRSLETVNLQAKWSAVHAATLALVAVAEIYLALFQQSAADVAYTVIRFAWPVLLLSLVPSLLLTFFPLQTLMRAARRLGPAWVYAAISSCALVALREMLRRSWITLGSGPGLLQDTAFSGVRSLLSVFYPSVISDPTSHLLGTQRFQVIIGGTCSGVQGLALLSVLFVAWFCYERKRLRLTPVLLLGCVALIAMWLLNIVRLATLIAIGDAGHPQIALNGFHSEAGWIALNAVTLCLLLLVERVAWFQRATPAPINSRAIVGAALGLRATRNVPAIYLLPFLAITAASVVSHAVSGGFEWLYPLRFFAAALALWSYRDEYRRMNFGFGAVSVFAGLAVAALWIGTYHLVTVRIGGRVVSEDLSGYVAALPPWERIPWITTRVLAAVITVPLAEELAFRGFVARRIVSADLEAVPYAKLSVAAILVSAVGFGLMHGNLWGPGIAAGVVFGLIAKYRGRLGEAVAAHATANLAIAAWVLLRGDFGLW